MNVIAVWVAKVNEPRIVRVAGLFGRVNNSIERQPNLCMLPQDCFQVLQLDFHSTSRRVQGHLKVSERLEGQRVWNMQISSRSVEDVEKPLKRLLGSAVLKLDHSIGGSRLSPDRNWQRVWGDFG